MKQLKKANITLVVVLIVFLLALIGLNVYLKEIQKPGSRFSESMQQRLINNFEKAGVPTSPPVPPYEPLTTPEEEPQPEPAQQQQQVPQSQMESEAPAPPASDMDTTDIHVMTVQEHNYSSPSWDKTVSAVEHPATSEPEIFQALQDYINDVDKTKLSNYFVGDITVDNSFSDSILNISSETGFMLIRITDNAYVVISNSSPITALD